MMAFNIDLVPVNWRDKTVDANVPNWSPGQATSGFQTPQKRSEIYNESWRRDFFSNSLELIDKRDSAAMKLLMITVVFHIMFVPITIFIFLRPNPMISRILIVLVDLVFLLPLAFASLRFIALALKFGNPRLILPTFPLFLGQKYKVKIPELPGDFSKMQVSLRCIGRHRYFERSVNGPQHARSIEYILYEDVRESDASTGLSINQNLDFVLPPDAHLSTGASEANEVFWNLRVTGFRSWLSYEASFVLPIYNEK